MKQVHYRETEKFDWRKNSYTKYGILVETLIIKNCTKNEAEITASKSRVLTTDLLGAKYYTLKPIEYTLLTT